ncbi:baseplate J protein [Paenibacillus sp. FSL A5-0031]|uniref:baseplate J/gp47 family protein n=1 Tax=Paenibacillus sp. FSL A5-0031 TaxID=1920420 RepID=UPI00096C1727|nr:baseplate J/gp47 family protein [Paenibacillus sp. FSL A5-0031]OME86931.1 baseplate J protein [Paenibacillus sp. FSL A5-0031]
MYEAQTKAAILQRMLDASPADIDKRQGAPTHDLLSPAAIEAALLYIELDNVLNFGFVDTTYGAYLDLAASEYGVTRKAATKSIGALTFSGANGTVIPTGTRAVTSGSEPVYFVTTTVGTISAGSVTVASEASDAGAIGNVGIGAVNTVIGNLVGVVTVNNAFNFVGGTDAESDDALRARILERAQRPATSGNAAQYRQWALEVAGVSDAKVYPIWDGAGTVKVVLLDEDKTAPDAPIVTATTTYIESVRPIGATVTVVGATEVAINVSVDVTISASTTLPAVKADIENGMRAYLKTLAFTDATVRYTQIAGVILNAEGVLDYTALTVNGGSTNVVIADGSVAVLGTVVAT